MAEMEWEGAHPKSDVLVSILVVPTKDSIMLFIPHQELLDLGYQSLEDFDVVRCNGRFFELQGYSDPSESWWVEEIELPDPAKEGSA